jgi:hypothetical protein
MLCIYSPCVYIYVYIYHPRQWIIGPSPRPVNQLSQSRAPDRVDRLLMPRPNRPTPHAPDRADQPRAPLAPCNSAILWFEAAILLQWTQPFCYSKLNHFVRHSRDFFSVILLQWTHPFTIVLSHFVILSNILEIFAQSICYSEFNHFATVLGYFGISSAILLQWTHPFCYRNSTILSDILEIFTQSFCYSELIHFASAPSHFVILSAILLQWLIYFAIVNSAIVEVLLVILIQWTQPFCYSVLSFCGYVNHCLEFFSHFVIVLSYF